MLGRKYLIQHFQNSFTLPSVLLSKSLGLIISSVASCGGELCVLTRMSLGVIGGLSQICSELGYKGQLLIR